MPTLDVSDVLLSPEFADRITVNKRVQGLSDKGRTMIVPTTTRNVLAVITAASPNDLERLPESQRMGRNLTVVTKHRLQGPVRDQATGENRQPDTIEWYGDTYIVKWVDPYPQYGAGFVQAIVGSMDVIDQPIPG